MEQVIEDLKAFIRTGHPDVSSFLITLKKDGTPYMRQIGTYIEGWTVQTISQPTNPKVIHLRNNPSATYAWIQQRPGLLSKNVWLQGTMEIVDDQDEVQRFLERRAKALGRTASHTPESGAVLLKLHPTFLRSEYIRENPRVFIMREFPEE